ncbi:MAG: hypothetical protein HY757_05735 [Nitrospirae bacterium]|nr:hypothetical protein [Nitrospirota bacterium]
MRKKGASPMQANVLLNHSEKYNGKYVAKRSFQDKEVVCSGDNPKDVAEKANKKGIINPVIFYVPKKGMVHIY